MTYTLHLDLNQISILKGALAWYEHSVQTKRHAGDPESIKISRDIYTMANDAIRQATEPRTALQSDSPTSDITPVESPVTANPDATTAMVWRPIADAPRDGTKFLGVKIMGNCPVYYVVYFFDDGRHNIIKGCDQMCEPTHWMPLPKPPIV